MTDVRKLPDIRPDYLGGSIVNLMASILSASGAEARYPPLRQLDPDTVERAQHIVLMVVDGLGYEYLASARHAPALQRHLAGGITSVFPPTTAAAVTTFLTGLAPQQHGLTGWFIYLREIGAVVSVLPFATRLGAAPLSSLNLSPERLLGTHPVFGSIRRDCYCVSPQDIAHSVFNEAHSRGARICAYKTLTDFFFSVEQAVKCAEAPSYVYAYWPRLDQLAHVHGIAHANVAEHLRDFDRHLEAFVDAMRGTDTLLLLTADHGFMDIAPGGAVHLGEHPRLANTLLLPLSGEPRAAYCYVAPPRRRAFLDYVEEELADRAVCVASEQLLEDGWFGPGPPHPELATRIGDHTLLAREGCAIFDDLPGERRSATLGVHGGVSRAELLVPLVVARL